MTAKRKELDPVQVAEIAKTLDVRNGDAVWVLAVDPVMGTGTADVLDADDVAWFTGADMTLGSVTRYRGGTIQTTFKRKKP